MTEALAWKRYRRSGDKQAVEFLLTRYAPLVHLTVSRHTKNAYITSITLGREDLLSVANTALALALATYDPNKSAFSTWAIGNMKHALQEAQRNDDPLSRCFRGRKSEIDALRARSPHMDDAEVGKKLGLKEDMVRESAAMPSAFAPLSSLDGGGSSETQGAEDYSQESVTSAQSSILADPALQVQAAAAREELAAAVCSLKPRTQSILRDYYERGMTYRAISKEQGVSESRIYQLATKGVARLRAMYLQGERLTA